jgi:CheY-like chemotaxis protein
MDTETQSRLFEPFFTTKETGKGTGLGLSTVYGIVKQSAGYILVESALHRGTNFDIYLPRTEAPADAARRAASRAAPEAGSELILLAEDEEALRRLARRVLEARGYAVLEAQSAEEAYALAQRFPGQARLLVTDIVMTGSSGRELARQMLSSWPNTKVLYVSGYVEGTMGSDNSLEPGAHFLQKPFTPEALVRKVREVLDS